MISRLRFHLSRLRWYRRRFGWRRTVRRLLAPLLGPVPGLEALPVDAPQPQAEPEPQPEPAPVPEPEPTPPAPAAEPAVEEPAPEPPAPPRRPPWTPLPVFHTPVRGRRRITVVLDAMAAGTPRDGVDTTIILACLLAQRCTADLRLVTRAEPPRPVVLQPLLQAHGVVMDGDIQCRFLPVADAKAELDLLDGEVLITDLWWNTAAALAAVAPARVIYLLQSDERGLDTEANADEGQRREALLSRRDLQCVIRSDALKQQLVREGFDHFETQALSFEPPPASVSTKGPQHGAGWPAALQPVLAQLATRV